MKLNGLPWEAGDFKRENAQKCWDVFLNMSMKMSLIDPVKFACETETAVVRGQLRKYYRIARAGRWYGGIATADCCGCNLRCVFCWSGAPRDHPAQIGKFYSPNEIFHSLIGCARRHGYGQLRLSGNEPTIGRKHLLHLLELIDQTNYKFILETNGILIGADVSYARELSRFKCLHVRVSLKGTNPEEFTVLTRSIPEGFILQLKALRNLLGARVSCHPAVMLSFSEEKLNGLKLTLEEIDSELPDMLEEEYVFLYPQVLKRLNEAGIKPSIGYSPNNIPKKLI